MVILSIDGVIIAFNNRVIISVILIWIIVWVVPYNKYLLLRYSAHINVEVCTSIKSVKYIYKLL